MTIQDKGIIIGIFFICIGIGLGLAVYFSDIIHVDLSSTGIPYIKLLPYILGGFGGFLAVVSLISLAKSK